MSVSLSLCLFDSVEEKPSAKGETVLAAEVSNHLIFRKVQHVFYRFTNLDVCLIFRLRKNEPSLCRYSEV